MENEEILKERYKKNIQDIIDKNRRFYGFVGNILLF